MEGIDFRPLKATLNNIAFQFIVWMAICVGAYIIAIIILRFIKVPNKLANFLATIAFLVAMYWSFMNGYIPGVEGSL